MHDQSHAIYGPSRKHARRSRALTFFPTKHARLGNILTCRSCPLPHNRSTCITLPAPMSYASLATGVLAGGLGQRFDPSGLHSKLLALLPDGTPVAVAAARHLAAATADVIAIVRPVPKTRDAAERSRLPRRLCADAARGMGASLAAGVRATPDANSWLVALGDMPWIAASTYEAVTRALDADDASIVAPRTAACAAIRSGSPRTISMRSPRSTATRRPRAVRQRAGQAARRRRSRHRARRRYTGGFALTGIAQSARATLRTRLARRVPAESGPYPDCTDDTPPAATIPLQTHARLAITETRRPCRATAVTHRASSP